MKNAIEWVVFDECHSACCDAPLLNYENNLGLCSECKEWSGPIEKDEDDEASNN